jgi:radical SAM/Cys-rich protein
MHDTRPLLLETDFPPIKRSQLETLQVNLGYRCNLSCSHCHVNAGPQRTESMSLEVIDQLLDFMACRSVKKLDLTGGAPEMNPHFKYLVQQARSLGVEVIDRCNLTILLQSGYRDMATFLADQGVTIVASLPCYLESNVSKQRGKGVYEESITALRELNALGYGKGTGLELSLVYNPLGPYLPPPQSGLQADYKRELQQRYGIVFDHLFTLTNMPISRFGAVLLSQGQFVSYMQLLKANYSEQNLEDVMCRSLISVDWQGYTYDCDFNQMIDLPLQRADVLASDVHRLHISELTATAMLDAPIRVGEHCYACTAGQGSSCGGALEAS